MCCFMSVIFREFVFRFDDVDIFVGLTHIILFAGNLFDHVLVGFQPFDLPVVVVGRIVLCGNLLAQVIDFGIVAYALDTAVFVNEDDENHKDDEYGLPPGEMLACVVEYFDFVNFHRCEDSVVYLEGKGNKKYSFSQSLFFG